VPRRTWLHITLAIDKKKYGTPNRLKPIETYSPSGFWESDEDHSPLWAAPEKSAKTKRQGTSRACTNLAMDA